MNERNPATNTKSNRATVALKPYDSSLSTINNNTCSSSSSSSTSISHSMKSAIRNNNNNGNSSMQKGGNDADVSWRKCGIKRRKRILREDDESGGNSFTIHKQTNIKRYFEVADRVLDQFYAVLKDGQSLEDTYLMGNRLDKFLSEVLPTHDQYHNPENARSRLKIRADLAQVRSNIEKVAFKIDQQCYIDQQQQLQHQQRQPSPHKRERRVTFNLEETKDGHPQQQQHFIEHQNYFSSPIDWNEDHTCTIPPQSSQKYFDDIPDLSFSSGSSSSGSLGSISFPSSSTSQSDQDQFVKDNWEPFDDWKITGEIARFENVVDDGNVKLMNDMFSQNDAEIFTPMTLEDNHNGPFDKTVETQRDICQTPDRESNKLNMDEDEHDEEYDEGNNSGDEEISEGDDDSDSSDDSECNYYEGIHNADLDAFEELTFVERIALENCAFAIDTLHEEDGDDSDADDSWAQNDDGEDEVSIANQSFEQNQEQFVNRQPLDSNRFHNNGVFIETEMDNKTPNADSCPVHLMAGGESIEESFDSKPHSDELITHQEFNSVNESFNDHPDATNSDNDNFQQSNNNSCTNVRYNEYPQDEQSDDDESEQSSVTEVDDHEEFKKELTDEFAAEFVAEFDLCSRGDKTTSTASTEALTIGDEDSDCDSTNSDEGIDLWSTSPNCLLGIARRDGYIPTIRDLNHPRGKSHQADNKEVEALSKEETLSKLEYLESKLRSMENDKLSRNTPTPNKSQNSILPNFSSSCMETTPSTSLKNNSSDVVSHSQQSTPQESKTTQQYSRSQRSLKRLALEKRSSENSQRKSNIERDIKTSASIPKNTEIAVLKCKEDVNEGTTSSNTQKLRSRSSRMELLRKSARWRHKYAKVDGSS